MKGIMRNYRRISRINSCTILWKIPRKSPRKSSEKILEKSRKKQEFGDLGDLQFKRNLS